MDVKTIPPNRPRPELHRRDSTLPNRKSDGIEFKIQTGKLYGTEDGFTRAEMHDFHAALGEMLGLGVPTAKAPMTASKPAKNPRRVNGGA